MAKSKVVIKREAAAKLPNSASECRRGAFLRRLRRGSVGEWRVSAVFAPAPQEPNVLVMQRLAGLVSEWRGTLSVPRNLKLGLLHPPLA